MDFGFYSSRIDRGQYQDMSLPEIWAIRPAIFSRIQADLDRQNISKERTIIAELGGILDNKAYSVYIVMPEIEYFKNWIKDLPIVFAFSKDGIYWETRDKLELEADPIGNQPEWKQKMANNFVSGFIGSKEAMSFGDLVDMSKVDIHWV